MLYIPFQSCDFMWIPAEWEGCTATCGSRGMQEREVFCVHNRTHNNNPPWQHMVDPEQCKTGIKPETTRPCNRVPCPAHWVSGNWSQVRDEQELNFNHSGRCTSKVSICKTYNSSIYYTSIPY